MLKAKDGDFFISDWLRNRNTVEYLGIWERIHNPDFNYGEFATIKSQAGLNSYKISVKEWVAKTNAIGLFAKALLVAIKRPVWASRLTQMPSIAEDDSIFRESVCSRCEVFCRCRLVVSNVFFIFQ